MLVGMREVFFFKNTVDKKKFPTQSVSLEIINYMLKKMQSLIFLVLSNSRLQEIDVGPNDLDECHISIFLVFFFSLVNYHLANPHNLSYLLGHLFPFLS